MNAMTLIFTDLEWLPPDGDLERCRLTYRLTDDDGGHEERYGTITVTMSRALLRLWQLDADEVAAEVGAQVRAHLADRILHGTLRPNEEVRLLSPSTVRLCPFDPQGVGPLPLHTPIRFMAGCRERP